MEKKQRVTFSPGEFAELFGKSQTWAYRQLYAGKVKATTEYGRIMIPAAEVEKILATAGIYDGIKLKKLPTKTALQKLIPKNAWQQYLAKRRTSSALKSDSKSVKATSSKGRLPWSAGDRQAAMHRLGGLKPGR